MRRRPSWLVALVAICALGCPNIASADAGIPMLAYLWPGFWVALPLVILIETVVATRVLNESWRRALKLSGIANLASTLLGIPMTWLLLLVVQGLTLRLSGVGGRGSHIPRWLDLLLLPVMAPLGVPLHPADDAAWHVVASAIWLCGMFFLASVWLEARVVSWRSGISQVDARRWSWRANAASYGIIEAILLALLLWSVVAR